jgi:hypothetical protein
MAPRLRSRGCAEAHPYKAWVEMRERRKEGKKEEENDNAEVLRTLRFAERKRQAMPRASRLGKVGRSSAAPLLGGRGAIRGRVLEFC